jgi:hypothetical protein
MSKERDEIPSVIELLNDLIRRGKVDPDTIIDRKMATVYESLGGGDGIVYLEGTDIKGEVKSIVWPLFIGDEHYSGGIIVEFPEGIHSLKGKSRLVLRQSDNALIGVICGHCPETKQYAIIPARDPLNSQSFFKLTHKEGDPSPRFIYAKPLLGEKPTRARQPLTAPE